jgi:hypothetical protein
MDEGKILSRVNEELSFFAATTASASIKFNKEIDNNRISFSLATQNSLQGFIESGVAGLQVVLCSKKL